MTAPSTRSAAARAAKRRWPCCSSTSTTSSPSTTGSGTPPATSCCSSWPSASWPACAPPTPSRGSAATSSGSCSRARTSATRSRPPSASWRRSRRASTCPARRCGSRPASASRSAARACATSRSSCAPPTARCTRPSAAASTASRSTTRAAPVVAADGSLRLFMSSEAQRAEIVALLEDPDALTMVFQPVLDLRTGRVAAYEALARFNRTPVRSPDKWFAQAHRFGLGAALEARALAAALAVPDRPAGTRLTLNLSLSSLGTPEIEAVLPERLEDFVIEVTENELAVGDPATAGAIAALRARGAALAVDDTGRGLRRPHARDAARPGRDQARPRAHHRHRLGPRQGRAGQLLRALRPRHRRHRLRRGHRDRGRAGRGSPSSTSPSGRASTSAARRRRGSTPTPSPPPPRGRRSAPRSPTTTPARTSRS